jgi:hypothetical protein
MSGYNTPPPHPGSESPSANNAGLTAEVPLLAKPGNGFSWCIVYCSIFNSNSTSGTGLNLTSASKTFGPLQAPAAKGGSIHPFPMPIVFPDNEAVSIATLDAVSTIYASVVAYKAISRQT